MTTNPTYATCPVCARGTRVLANGQLAQHVALGEARTLKTGATRCEGSGKAAR